MVNSDKKRYVKLFLLHPIEIGMRAIWKLSYAITWTAESRNTLYRMTMCCLVLKVRVQRLAIVLLAHLSLRLQDLNLECYSILIPRFIAIQILFLRRSEERRVGR